MRGKKVKQIRKYIKNNLENALIQVRNNVGSKTEEMDARNFYQNCKKIYKMGNFKLS